MNQNSIVTEARALLGVPFRLHGRDPNRGLDCAGMLLTVLHRAGYITALDCETFARTPDTPTAVAFLKSRARTLPVTSIEQGDVILGIGTDDRAAVGIISQTSPRKLIHVTVSDGVVEEDFPPELNWSIAYAFRF